MNKLDLINLLEEACGGKCNAEYNPCAYKEAALELRDMKPVAWGIEAESGEIIDCITPTLHLKEPGDYAIPLYTLEQSNE